jgi:predicted metal-dependent phosphoesterase TrpH
VASLIDLHTHTSHSSLCGRMTAEELIEAAIEAGLDGVAVTEHHLVEGAEVAQKIGQHKYGFPVFRGVEARATVVGDVLVFGYYCNLSPQISWTALRQLVSDAGGVLIPAHPFRHWDHNSLWNFLEEHGIPVDNRPANESLLLGLTAIEVYNGGCRPKENDQAADLARCLRLPGVGGSDAHSPEEVGRAFTWFPGKIETDGELVAALMRGGYRAIDRRG